MIYSLLYFSLRSLLENRMLDKILNTHFMKVDVLQNFVAKIFRYTGPNFQIWVSCLILILRGLILPIMKSHIVKILYNPNLIHLNPTLVSRFNFISKYLNQYMRNVKISIETNATNKTPKNVFSIIRFKILKFYTDITGWKKLFYPFNHFH